MQKTISKIDNIAVIIASVDDLKIENNEVKGVQLDDERVLFSSQVILTTGTFLSGIIHIGSKKIPAGRVCEAPSYGITNRLKSAGLSLGRLKTGTPARIRKSSIDFSKLTEQAGDHVPRPFSEMTQAVKVSQISCFITRTNEETHKII